ncbi:MAG: histidinol dehydrogenase [Ignavibacteria bacterium RIFCSPLOWO2_02_FULL_55_14]|nr:MAG: histidinol dehydrogenase [Ignavibacteria bacterium RIFCSPLOWO2_02_FULL_55_14]HAV22733.1 histidinol dehydrogenase [Bacteroidota bacterium]
MKIYYNSKLRSKDRRRLLMRPASQDPKVDKTVARICREVKTRGDSAVRRFAKQFDKVAPAEFRVSPEEIAAAAASIDPVLRTAITIAAENIRAFHRTQGLTSTSVETTPGVRCWREIRPMFRVGLYVPAGSASLPSTALMLGIPAVLAGCSKIVLCCPPQRDGTVNAAVLAVAKLLGITEVYRIGGAQAIAAMAYGTESLPKVNKIFGPGNAFVTAAKRFVSFDPDGTAIDLLAGPSELLIIADGAASPQRIAADLLSQAEHDPRSQVVLVTTDDSLAKRVSDSLKEMIVNASRRSIIEGCMKWSYMLIVPTLSEAIAFANAYAPEHMIVDTSDPVKLVPEILNAGSVFLGSWAPVTAGDYASGTNHTLPTGGAAISSGGVTVESFQKTISFQSITRDGLERLRTTLTTLSTAEGLSAHAAAVEVRFS